MSDHDAPHPSVRRLFEPLSIGSLTLRNRIVNTTHGTGLGEARELRYLVERSRGGAGFMGVHSVAGIYGWATGPAPEAAVPDWDQKALSPTSAAGIAHYDDLVIPALQRKADAIRSGGAACFAQVYHSGSARHGATATPVSAPSAVPDPYEAKMPAVLTAGDIEELVVAFAHGIRRIREAGMDAAEIHGAHGYLVNQFLSPYANRRDDRWGGSPERRVQFVVDVLDAARRMVGDDFPIGLRIGVDADGADRGITTADLVDVARRLGPRVAWLSVSGGNYAGFGAGPEPAYVSPWSVEPGHNAPAAAAVRAAVDVPVVVTGRITDPAHAEHLLADGVADLVGMVRALIADPELPTKARAGRATDIRPCLGLSECHHIGPHRTPLTCAMNAAAAREDELALTLAPAGRTVVVVGAGPAGLEAARVAAARGHTVYLADRRRSLGGTPAVLALDPNRRTLGDQAAWFEGQLAALGVTLMLGNEVTADELVEFAPDVVIVATGGTPVRPDVPGVGEPNVMTALDVIAGPSAPVGPRALVVSGLDDHLAGPTVAELLADRGHTVELIGEHVDFAKGAEDGTRIPLLHRLLTKGVTVSMTQALVEVGDGGAVVRHTFRATQRRLDDTTVVLACGLAPDTTLADALRARVPEVHVIGDALAPRRIMHATLDAARLAGRL